MRPLSYACIDCGSRAEAQTTTCATCKTTGPLMNLSDASVRSELIAEDDRRRMKRRYQMVWPAVPIGIVVAILLGGGLLGFALGGAAGYGASLAFAAMFPAKQLFTDLHA